MSQIGIDGTKYSECFKGRHDLEMIMAIRSDYDGDRVVRWCSRCGAIVIDLEADGRLMDNEMKMKAPLITREALASVPNGGS